MNSRLEPFSQIPTLGKASILISIGMLILSLATIFIVEIVLTRSVAFEGTIQTIFQLCFWLYVVFVFVCLFRVERSRFTLSVTVVPLLLLNSVVASLVAMALTGRYP